MIRWLRKLYTDQDQETGADTAFSATAREAWERQHLAATDAASREETEPPQAGLEFVATLHICTPLAVLRHHGEVFHGEPGNAPVYGSPADGVWLPHRPADEAAPSGPGVDPDYIAFLKDFRSIVEGAGSVSQKLQALEALPERNAAYRRLWEAHEDSHSDFPRCVFTEALEALPGIGPSLAVALFEAGLPTVDAVLEASDAELLAVPGLEPETLARLRGAGGP